MNVRRALISVSDKAGIVEFARGLAALGAQILSTGGTAQLLEKEGVKVTEVSAHTGFPEMLDGRVKTLHPKIHGGILARRDLHEHMAALDQAGIAPIDLIVVNLYPFEATVADPDCTLDDAIENIDIGGPAMVRSAAKNWQHVAVLTDASQYADVLEELQRDGGIGEATRFALSVAAFNRISNYDAAISDYLSALPAGVNPGDGRRMEFPAQSNGRFVKLQDLRYGENPHQRAAFYRDLHPAPGSLVMARQLQGKALSYNNIADADAAWECVKSFAGAACVIVKHANPCGAAVAATGAQAYAKAFRTDTTSAFGGIIAFNVPVDGTAAQAAAAQFVEVLIAPGYSKEALEVFSAKANMRVLEVPLSHQRQAFDYKRVGGGLLVQSSDAMVLERKDLVVKTKKQPTETQWADLLFAWTVAKFVKSNAIVFCRDGATIGVGAGQMSRIDSARIAAIKAKNAGLVMENAVVASDAFFPFRDGLDAVIDAGAAAVIQPGGSVRDDEVVAAANERGIAMVFTGVRHFRH